MSTETNKAVVRRLVEQGVGGGALDAAVASYAPDFVYHNPVLTDMPDLPPGPEAVRALTAATRAAFPDLTYTVESLVAEEDTVAVFYTWRGTQTGELAGLPPTGRAVAAAGAMFCRLAGGRIVEQWDVDDRLGVMQQLGLVPMSGQAAAGRRQDDPSRRRDPQGPGSAAQRFSLDDARRLGAEIGVDWNAAAFDAEQLRQGLEVELEHGTHDPQTDVTGDDPIVTAKIALAHLNELADYYTRLAAMESAAERSG